MKKHKHILLVLLAVFFTVNINAQTLTENIGGYYQTYIQDGTTIPPTPLNIVDGMTEKIWLTETDGGAVPTDLYYHQPTNKVFIYGKRNIVVVDAATNSLVARLPLTYTENGNTFNETSQFYPVIEQTEYLNDNHFAYDDDRNLIYCLSEDLRVYSINPVTYTVDYLYYIVETCSNLEFKNAFIRYDSRLNWLYTVYSKSSYGFLKIKDVANSFANKGSLIFSNDEIRSFEFNDSSNEFYLGLNNTFYSFAFDPNTIIGNSNVTQTQIGSSYTGNNYAGNMLYVNKAGGIHKLFCFPNGGTGNQNFFVKDLSSGGAVSAIQCPANITSACFDGTDKVYLSYKSTTGSPDLRILSATNYATIDSDIYTQGVNDINTRSVSGNDYTLDMEMLDGQLIITKESEVCLYNRTPTSPDPHVLLMSQGKNNYFNRVVENANKAYVIGTWSTELDVFMTTGQTGSALEVGGIAYKACYNPDKNKIYFYNTHIQEKAKIYILNTGNNNVSVLEMDGSICDIEIDPNTNHALVSTGDASPYIKVIDGNTNSLLTPMQLQHGYIGEMFVSSNNNLYCIIREGGTGYNPGIEIWNLATSGNSFVAYQQYNAIFSLNGKFTEMDNDGGARAVDDFVYAAIDGINASDGVATKINDEQYSYSNIQIPSDFIDIEIVGKYVYVVISGTNKKIVAIDDTDWLTKTDLLTGIDVSDIEPNTYNNSLYVLHNDGLGKAVSSISALDVTSNKITDLYHESASLKYNESNNSLYIYVPFISHDCTYDAGGIYEVFDDDAGDAGYMFFPNGDRQRNRYSNTAYNPQHDMIIDQLSHKIYYAGGGHSCINVVEQVNTYKLLLREDKDVTWLSIPRHYHTGGTVLPNSTPTSTVFDQNTIDYLYNELNLDYNKISGSSGNYTSGIVYAHWLPSSGWTKTLGSNMDDIVSTRGYILDLSPNWTGNNFLHLNGTVENSNTTMPLYCGEENWVGYFIPEVQDVFDALGDELSNLNVIKHQDWTCARNVAQAPCTGTKSTLGTSPQDWTCSGRHNVKFGDMLMLTPVHDATMTWNWTGNPPSEAERPEATYYVPEEQATYTTMSIELDTTSNPQEIGAFVNDSCVGACSVLPEDTIVVMQAYLGDQQGDSVTFKEHYASRDINEREIKEYRVLNFDNMLKEERTIKTGEGEPLIVVSFKNGKTKEEQPSETETGFVVYPNPTKGKINFSLNVEEEIKLIISIFSINGKLVSKPIKQTLEPGFITSSIKLFDNSGNELKPGIYILKANIGKITETRKLIIE